MFFFCGYECTLTRDPFLVVCQVLCAKVVGVTQIDGFLRSFVNYFRSHILTHSVRLQFTTTVISL